MEINLICLECNQGFTLKRKRPNAKYCSLVCANKANSKIYEMNNILKSCLQCGVGFKVLKSKSTRKFCSKRCAGIFNNPQTTEESNKYKRIWIKGKKVFEHRYVMEQHLGRKLLVTEDVHHINRIKYDNRIENLQVIDKKTHGKMSASYRYE